MRVEHCENTPRLFRGADGPQGSGHHSRAERVGDELVRASRASRDSPPGVLLKLSPLDEAATWVFDGSEPAAPVHAVQRLVNGRRSLGPSDGSRVDMR